MNPKDRLMTRLTELVSVSLALGGEKAITEMLEATLEIGCWWP